MYIKMCIYMPFSAHSFYRIVYFDNATYTLFKGFNWMMPILIRLYSVQYKKEDCVMIANETTIHQSSNIMDISSYRQP